MNDTLKEHAEQFAQFILENYPDARQWEDPVGYCAWHISHFFTAAVCDEDTGQIVALASARPVERAGLGVLPYYFNRGGTCLHVDLLIDVTNNNRAITALRQICQHRFPECTTVTMFRHFEEKLHVYTIDKFWKSLGKIRRKRKKRHYEHAQNA